VSGSDAGNLVTLWEWGDATCQGTRPLKKEEAVVAARPLNCLPNRFGALPTNDSDFFFSTTFVASSTLVISFVVIPTPFHTLLYLHCEKEHNS
jgi:hypothetical protein